ncbi:MAG: OB-fold domain-containing protein, partial [bacterium]
DEDSITMAVAAAMECLAGIDLETVDGVLLASTSAPFREKQASSLIAGALGLRRDIKTADYAHSLRAATQALSASADAVETGRCRNVLVLASDCRLAAPGSDLERNFGDGAAALLVGGESGAARITADHSISSEFIGVWRTGDDPYVRSWEDRFVLKEGYAREVRTVVESLLADSGYRARDFDHVAVYGPDPRSHAALLTSLGLQRKAEAIRLLFERVGNTGAAFAPMMLVAALEVSGPGQKILLVSQGDGADAFVVEVTGRISADSLKQSLCYRSRRPKYIPNYSKYLNIRSILERDPQRLPDDLSSLPLWWRDHVQTIGLYGQKCRVCGMVAFPKQRICPGCQTKDQAEDYRLANKKGTLFTFTRDFLVPTPNPPTVTAFVDFEGGGRIFCELTDIDPDEVAIGSPVETTFRRIHDAGGLPHYGWKCRPEG